jgi:anti-sigma regulatory factor (Ser/Thr protein kinase)
VARWVCAREPSGFRELWCEELDSVAGLAALRARLRAELTGSATVVHPEREHWSERLVLIADELASNALRHGGQPVATALSRVGDQWMVSVHDRSPEVPPVLAQGRDPELGGLGLYLIADLAVRHGWFTDRGSKTVWAVVAADDAA